MGVWAAAPPAPREASGPAQPVVTLQAPFPRESAPPLVPTSEVKKARQPSAPSYPPEARSLNLHGDVLLEVWIDATGKPTRSAVLWGPVPLRETAIAYVMRWEFRPFLLDGKPIPVRFRMVMPFRLRSGGTYQKLPEHLIIEEPPA